MTAKRSPFSFIRRRWEIVILAFAVCLGWAYWTDQPPPSTHAAQVEVRWKETADAGPVRTLEDLDHLLKSREFLEAAVRESIVSRFSRSEGGAPKPLAPEHYLSTEEAVALLSQFESARNEERNSVLLSFTGPSRFVVEERARLFGRTLLLLHSASVNRRSLEVRDFLRDRIAEWTEREHLCTQWFWKLRGNAQIPTAGRVASKPGGEAAEAASPDPSIHDDPLSLYQPHLARLGGPVDSATAPTPLADPALKACRTKLLEAQKLEADLLGLQTRLADLAGQLDPPPSKADAIASSLQRLNDLEADLIRLREERRIYEEAFREFDLSLAPEEVRSSLPFQVAIRTPEIEESEGASRFQRYQVWGACGAAVGVLMAKLLDRTALSGSENRRNKGWEKGSEIG